MGVIIGLPVFASCPLITGGFHHRCFASCSFTTGGCNHSFTVFEVVLLLQVAAFIGWTVFASCLSLHVAAITGLTVFASCPLIAGGSAAIIGLTVLQVVCSLQVDGIIGFYCTLQL